ncbi:TonB-dependent receptor [Novosphingobium resinovorum]|uniref:TonB-dependent receptor n=1 Tax=Novosphingobium resinovorum TaxID=158500 RepID=UPI00360DABBC
MTKRLKGAASILAVAAGLVAVTAHAQSSYGGDATAADGQLSEIVVTAQKRSENLQDVPLSVSAFSAADLAKQNQRDIQDLAGRVPSLTISPSPSGPGAANISLRGISFQDIEKSFEPGVGVVMDGVYLSTSTGQLLQSFDFQQIEVLRGPQGTLFGKNTTGGALNVTRTRPEPSEPLSGRARVVVGSYGRHDFEGSVSIPVVTDLLAVKVAGFSLNDHGTFYNRTLDRRVSRKNYQAISAAVRLTPADFDFQVTYDHVTDKSDLPALISTYSSTSRPTNSPGLLDGSDSICRNANFTGICNRPIENQVTAQNIVPEAYYNLDAVTVNAKADLGPLTFAAVSGYRTSREWALQDPDATEYDLWRTYRPQKFHQFSQEMRLESNFDGPINFVAGVYYFTSTYSMRQSTQIARALSNPAVGLDAGYLFPSFGVHQRYDSTALFAQADWQVFDGLTLTVGGRQTWDDKSFRFDQYANGTSFPSTAAIIGRTYGRAKFNEFTPRVALRYEVTPDISVFGSFSKGYNTGGFNGRAAVPALIGPYQPETLKAYEVGFKAELFNRKLRVNGAVFQNDFADKQEEVITVIPSAPFTGTAVENASNARFRGAELELTALPLTGLTLTGSVGYLDAKYLDFNASLRSGTPVVDNSGLILRRAPKWTLSGAIDYEVPAGPGDLGFNFSARYISRTEQHILNDPLGSVPGYENLDAAVRYSMPVRGVDMTATAFVKNLTDKNIQTAFTTGGFNSVASYIAQGIGRTWGVELSARF